VINSVKMQMPLRDGPGFWYAIRNCFLLDIIACLWAC